ncbi:type II toxin-antitoxin system VapC family toxin [Candidatus Poriferisodalis sp.]|uniref:type II toxin-antitoxin system VapC family toxin n=1 Tax=Candidatus Poriferisodalis sp. TaxID=3101277 RepID=UPI003B51FF0F
MIVVDASVAVTAVGAVGELANRALRRISLEPALAPQMLDLEVTSALRQMHLRSAISEAEARRGLRHLAGLRIRRIGHAPLIARCWELRNNLTAYDASYVALAEQAGATLLTSDAHLARAPGIECDVELFDAST